MSRRRKNSGKFAGVFVACLYAAQAFAAIEGVVQNGTTGRPQAGVPVFLMKLEQGMEQVGNADSDSSGKFHFDQSPGATPFLLRAEFDGVMYSEMIPPGTRSGDVRVTVYRATSQVQAPNQHVMLFEPSGSEMVVNESFLYRNETQPPVTYNDKKGTLRFYLPAAAKGVVQVSASGPGGMPVRAKADAADQPDIYKVDFPIKPGESRVDLTYRVPYTSSLDFTGRTLYPDVVTRIAAPAGVTLAGENLQSMGQEPKTHASIFNVGDAAMFHVKISGEGRLAREAESAEAGGGGDSISIVPAAVYKQFWVVLGFAAAILALGFYALYTGSGAPAAKNRKT